MSNGYVAGRSAGSERKLTFFDFKYSAILNLTVLRFAKHIFRDSVLQKSIYLIVNCLPYFQKPKFFSQNYPENNKSKCWRTQKGIYISLCKLHI